MNWIVNEVLDKWTLENNGILLENLKIIDLGRFFSYGRAFNQLAARFLSLPSLEVFCGCAKTMDLILSLPSLPSTMKRFELKGFDYVFLKDTKRLIYSTINPSQFKPTHLAVNGKFSSFPNNVFQLPQLEYLNLFDVECKSEPSNQYKCDNLKHLAIRSNHLIPFLSNLNELFPKLERF